MELLAFGDTGWGDELFRATLMTIAVSITAMLIGFSFAAIFTPLKLSKFKSLNLIANVYTTVIRGVPELLVIYLFFFGGSGAIMFVASIFGYNEYIEINAFVTGSFAIGIISGAYSTEVFRGAIQSIDKGQFEAAKVLGFSKFKQFYKIILPQMLRLAIPNLSNVWQITLKDTSLISVTGLVEIISKV
jgi:octopine/nopaline transport system permease protein